MVSSLRAKSFKFHPNAKRTKLVERKKKQLQTRLTSNLDSTIFKRKGKINGNILQNGVSSKKEVKRLQPSSKKKTINKSSKVQQAFGQRISALNPNTDGFKVQDVSLTSENEVSSESDDPDYVPSINAFEDEVRRHDKSSDSDPDYILQVEGESLHYAKEMSSESDDPDYIPALDTFEGAVLGNYTSSDSDPDYIPKADAVEEVVSENESDIIRDSNFSLQTNGFTVNDLEDLDRFSLMTRDSQRNYENEIEDDSDSELSVGSDAEEIVFNDADWQREPDSSDDDSMMASMSYSQMQNAYKEFVENYKRDHEHVQTVQDEDDDDASSNDSCPELVPIYSADGFSAADGSSESSFGTEYSCEHSDCCGYSEDGVEEKEEEEENGEEDGQWHNVDDGDEDIQIEESENSFGSEDSSDDSDFEMDDTDRGSSSDYMDEESDEILMEENSGIFEDEEDPHFFNSDRPPLIVSAGQSSKHTWSKLPLDLSQSISLFQHDTTIENIVQQVRLNQPRPAELSVLNEVTDELSEPEESEGIADETQFDDVEDLPPPMPEAFENNQSLDNTVVDEVLNETDFDPEVDISQQSQNRSEDDLDISTTSTFSHIRPKFFNSLNSRQVLLVLKSELHFHGILNVTLLAGNARIYGFSLRPNQPVTAFSPRGHSFVSIQPMQPANANKATQKAAYLDTVQSILTSMESDFISHDLFAAIECFDPSNDVLLLLEPEARQLPGLNMIQKYMRQLVFPNVNTFNQRGAYYSSEFILRSKFYLLPRTKLHVSPQWSSVPLDATSRTVVLGGKGVGKSTFVRFAANSCVQRYGRVLLIDLDIGQPEIFVPQTISATLLTHPLLGPGYLQNHQPEYALLFGEINVTVSPLKYLRCVLQLLRHCASNPDYTSVPWIINTMGYNKGFGPELIAAVLRSFTACTDVVQIQSQRQLDNYEQIMNYGIVNDYRFNFFHAELLSAGKLERATYQTHVVRSMARKFGDRTNDWDMSAKDTRFAIVLSHLGGLLRDGGDWITDVKPVW